MKVICINVSGLDWNIGLTVGKIYDVYSIQEEDKGPNCNGNKCYRIMNDRQIFSSYDERFVMPLEKHRQRQLDLIQL